MKPILLFIMVMFAAQAVMAEPSPAEQRLRDQLRESVSKLRAQQTSLDALQAEKAALEQERDALKANGGGKAASNAEVLALKQSLAQAQQQAETLRTNLNDVLAAARKIEAERNDLRAKSGAQTESLAAAQTEMKTCAERNAKLVKVGNEILDAYRGIGLGTVLRSKEPFIGMKRVQLENIAQGFGDQLYENGYSAREKAAPTSP